jgi:hypothetical protein
VLGRNVGEREHQTDLLLLSLRYKRPAPPLSEAFYTFYPLIYSWRLWKKGESNTLATIALRRPAPTGEAVNKTLHIEKAELRSSSRSSSFACHYRGHKPNQLVLVIQRVTKSPGIPVNQAIGRRPPCYHDLLAESLRPGILEARH